MNYQSLLAISLGIVSVVITLKYLNLYQSLSTSVKKLSTTCNQNMLPKPMLDIQNKLGLNDTDFFELISNNANKIIEIIKPQIKKSTPKPTPKSIPKPTPKSSPISKVETFENFENFNYLDVSKRNVDFYPLSNMIYSESLDKPDTHIQTYLDEYNIAKNNIFALKDYLPDVNQPRKEKIERDFPNYQDKNFHFNFIKNNNWCQIDYDNKPYCFSVPDPSLCTNGKIIKDTKNCFYGY